MADKKLLLELLKGEHDHWEELLATMSERQIIEPYLPAGLSIKDVIAHLWAWQQRSISRIEAALVDKEPEFPQWPDDLRPDSDESVDRTNAWIYHTYHDKPWPAVYTDWKTGFLRFIELGKAIPEKNLMEPGRYAWMEGHPLSSVLQSSFDHHHIEHLEPLLAFLSQNK